MDDNTKRRIHTFDSNLPIQVIDRRLPHWSQAGTISFITWRTWDSIPDAVLRTWISERDELLRSNGIDSTSSRWQEDLKGLDSKLVQECKNLVSQRWNDHLDACHGACVLRNPELSKVVEDSFLHFDGERYDLTDWVIKPNHVHLLVGFPGEELMLQQCESWKHYTAASINRHLKRRGRFWQTVGFDCQVRSLEQFEQLRRYIAGNPLKAGLQSGEYRYGSKEVGK